MFKIVPDYLKPDIWARILIPLGIVTIEDIDALFCGDINKEALAKDIILEKIHDKKLGKPISRKEALDISKKPLLRAEEE